MGMVPSSPPSRRPSRRSMGSCTPSISTGSIPPGATWRNIWPIRRTACRGIVGGNVIYMDLHARWKRYGIGATQKELLQSVKDAFPFATAVDPGGVGAVVGEKDWLW